MGAQHNSTEPYNTDNAEGKSENKEQRAKKCPLPAGERVIALSDMFYALSRKELYLNVLNYLFILIPFVIFLNLVTCKLDSMFGFARLWGSPLNVLLFVFFTVPGILIVWWSYTCLVLIGEGSPSPHLGGTKKLVRTGPYALVRHPSVVGKLLGVLGMGCLFASPTFLFILLPALLIYSLIYNRFYQEKGCEEIFGNEYLEYRREVPMIIPNPKKMWSVINTPEGLRVVITLLLFFILLLQSFQIYWLLARKNQGYYVFIPLYFSEQTQRGAAVSLPPKLKSSGPYRDIGIMGPTLTLEDVVRGLAILMENPDKRLALSPEQKKKILKLVAEASKEREEIIAYSREIARTEDSIKSASRKIFDILNGEQKDFIKSKMSDLDAEKIPESSWENLYEYLNRK